MTQLLLPVDGRGRRVFTFEVTVSVAATSHPEDDLRHGRQLASQTLPAGFKLVNVAGVEDDGELPRMY